LVAEEGSGSSQNSAEHGQIIPTEELPDPKYAPAAMGGKSLILRADRILASHR